MTLESGIELAACLWLSAVFIICLHWRRSVWIESHYERNGHFSTHWWAWPHNTGKPINAPKS